MSYKGTGLWVREQLLTSTHGVSATDLHSTLKELWKSGQANALGIPYRGGRSHSFHRYFLWFHQLGFTTPVGTTKSVQRHGVIELSIPKQYYKITPKGRHAPERAWINPVTYAHPEWASSGDRKRAYMKDWKQAHNLYPTPGRPHKQTLDGYLEKNLGDEYVKPVKKVGRPHVQTVQDWLNKLAE